jgi:DNA-binding IclR family transcriptional regulator
VSARERAAVIAEVQATDRARWDIAKGPFAKAFAEYQAHGWVINAGVLHKGYNTVAVPIIAPDGSVPYTANCGSAAVLLTIARLRSEVGPRLIDLAGKLRFGLSPQELRPRVA